MDNDFLFSGNMDMSRAEIKVDPEQLWRGMELAKLWYARAYPCETRAIYDRVLWRLHIGKFTLSLSKKL